MGVFLKQLHFNLTIFLPVNLNLILSSLEQISNNLNIDIK